MGETMLFPIGAEVICTDGTCGYLLAVVVDPVARAVTHLVVEPKRRRGLGRLVPVDQVDVTSADRVRLRCDMAEFNALPDAEETDFIPGFPDSLGYGQDQVYGWPYYGLSGMGSNLGIGMAMGNAPQPVVTDLVPPGEIEVRRGDQVQAVDGSIGRVKGLVIDPSDHRVTHVLLQEGHLWGRKEVAIPISAVSSVTEGIRVALTKEQVGDLPPVDFDRPAGT
jgi:sporulation protein YlmC with PRC-barrel domain